MGRTTAGVGALAGPAGELTGAAVGTVMPDDGPGAPFTIVGLSATKCVAFRSEPVLRAQGEPFGNNGITAALHGAVRCSLLDGRRRVLLHSANVQTQQRHIALGKVEVVGVLGSPSHSKQCSSATDRASELQKCGHECEGAGGPRL